MLSTRINRQQRSLVLSTCCLSKPNRPETYLLPPEGDVNNDEDYEPNGPTEQEKSAKSVRKHTRKWDRVMRKARRHIKETQKK